jgi:hypothetical protein
VLGVKENATSEEIRAAHIKLALCLHPDKNVGVNELVQRLAQERFLEAQEAYETLSNIAKRKEYDEALAAVRSEGEYYIPAAPNHPPKQNVSARCDRCRMVAGEPMHHMCEDCRREIAALEREVKARRQLGVTSCKQCGRSKSPLEVSPLSGVCPNCWEKIVNEVKKQDLRTGKTLVGFLFYCISVWLSASGHMEGILFVMLALWFPWFLLKDVMSRRKQYSGIWKPLAVWSFFLSWAVWLSATGHSKAGCFVTLMLIGLQLFIKTVTS